MNGFIHRAAEFLYRVFTALTVLSITALLFTMILHFAFRSTVILTIFGVGGTSLMVSSAICGVMFGAGAILLRRSIKESNRVR